MASNSFFVAFSRDDAFRNGIKSYLRVYYFRKQKCDFGIKLNFEEMLLLFLFLVSKSGWLL